MQSSQRIFILITGRNAVLAVALRRSDRRSTRNTKIDRSGDCLKSNIIKVLTPPIFLSAKMVASLPTVLNEEDLRKTNTKLH